MISRRRFLAASAAASTLALGAPRPALWAADDKPGQTRNTRFAVNVEMWWSKLPFHDRLVEAAKLGYSGVELWPWRNKKVDDVAEAAQWLKLDIVQFTAWGFSPGLNDPKNHNHFVEEIEASCAVAKKWNCKMMTVVAGDDIPGVSQEKMHDAVIEGLRRAAPIAEKHGVTLILEPMNIKVDHKGHCLYGSAPSTRITRAVNSKFVKLNWDLYHMYITEGNLLDNLKAGYDQVGYLQIADHPGRNEPGTGEIDFPALLKGVKDLGYTGYVGLELRPKAGERAAAEAVRKADKW